MSIVIDANYQPVVLRSDVTWQDLGDGAGTWIDAGGAYVDNPYRAATWRDFAAQGAWRDLENPNGPFASIFPFGIGSTAPHPLAMLILSYVPLSEVNEAFSQPGLNLSPAVRGEIQGTIGATIQSLQSTHWTDYAEMGLSVGLQAVVGGMLAAGFGALGADLLAPPAQISSVPTTPTIPDIPVVADVPEVFADPWDMLPDPTIVYQAPQVIPYEVAAGYGAQDLVQKAIDSAIKKLISGGTIPAVIHAKQRASAQNSAVAVSPELGNDGAMSAPTLRAALAFAALYSLFKGLS